MTYSESAKGITITQARAFQEIEQHDCDISEFLSDMGDHTTYQASDVLSWLGY